MTKRTAHQHTERWPLVPPSTATLLRTRPRDRWDDRDIFHAFMLGGLAALVIVTVLALALIASMAG